MPLDNAAVEHTTMSMLGRLCTCLFATAAILVAQPALVLAQTPPAAPGAGHQEAPAPRDGRHDFDFMIGTWKVHLKRLVKPLTGSTTWVELEGRDVMRKVWDGANLSEFTADNPATQTHIQGLTLRLYNPKSHQWSLYWSNSNDGTLGLPATVGQFTNGRGEFFDQEEFQGRQIIVRYVWSDITPNSAHFEQAFSADGGKRWEPNWISTITREKP
jgi:hypothetical protein